MMVQDWKLESDNRTKTMIVRKIGNWEIGLIKYSGNPRVYLMVRGNWYGENPIIYSHMRQVGYEYPERIPQSVKDYIYNNADKLYDLQREENNKEVPNYMSGFIGERKW